VRLAALLVACAACGRVGFDEKPQDAALEAPVDAPPDAPATLLTCGAPAGFDIGADAWQSLRATGTASGYVVAGENAGAISGYAFGFDGTGTAALGQRTGGVALADNATDHANMGLVARGDSIVLAVMIGRPDATGSLRGAFDPSLTGASNKFTGEIPAPVAAARGDGDEVAYLTVNPSDTELDMQLLDDSGALTGEQTYVADGAEHTGDAAIARANNLWKDNR